MWDRIGELYPELANRQVRFSVETATLILLPPSKKN